LGQEVDAIREIKKMIGTNFSNYYDIRRWPIICDALLEKAVCSSNVQAGSAKSANQN
jgi:hypothetical protein